MQAGAVVDALGRSWSAPGAALATQFAVVAMLATGLLLRRSLGAIETWFVTGLCCVGYQVAGRLVTDLGLPRDVILSVAEMMVLPTILLIVARSQAVPGLRRGQMTDEQRRQWVLRHALRQRPPAMADRATPATRAVVTAHRRLR